MIIDLTLSFGLDDFPECLLEEFVGGPKYLDVPELVLPLGFIAESPEVLESDAVRNLLFQQHARLFALWL